MPHTLSTATHALQVAAGRLSGASVSLQDLIARQQPREPGDAITAEMALQIGLEQQGPFILEELRTAIAGVEEAMAISAALNAPVVVVERRAA